MTYSVSINSSIFQPLVDFRNWCKIETAKIIKLEQLPLKDKWSEIIQRITIVCSIIIPIIGLLMMLFSSELMGDYSDQQQARLSSLSTDRAAVHA